MTSGGDVSAQSIRRMTLPPIYGLGLVFFWYSFPTLRGGETGMP